MPPRSAWNSWVWPLAATMRASEAALKSWGEVLGFAPEEMPSPEEPTWVTPNTVRIELPAMRLRANSPAAAERPLLSSRLLRCTEQPWSISLRATA